MGKSLIENCLRVPKTLTIGSFCQRDQKIPEFDCFIKHNSGPTAFPASRPLKKAGD